MRRDSHKSNSRRLALYSAAAPPACARRGLGARTEGCVVLTRLVRPRAQQLNMQPQVINEYESGKAIPNNAIIAKIERALGAKLPRAKK
mmetsp:Transcript_16678/g.38231  ORF Transcript_16678/g.38231 Transcript_16678/m.38231 type:complete len:89 (+) Transcript_16678:335-601(+)